MQSLSRFFFKSLFEIKKPDQTLVEFVVSRLKNLLFKPPGKSDSNQDSQLQPAGWLYQGTRTTAGISGLF
jgi:hypothetical protein